MILKLLRLSSVALILILKFVLREVKQHPILKFFYSQEGTLEHI